MFNAPRSHAARLGRAFAVLALVSALISSARAGTGFTLTGWTPVVENLPGGGYRVVPNQHVRTDALKAAQRILERIPSGSVRADDVLKIGGKAGELPVKVRQVVTVADAGAAIARCVRNPVCVAAAVAAGAYLASKLRTRPSSDGGLEQDPGQDLADYPAWRCIDPNNITPVYIGGSPEAACSSMGAARSKTYVDGIYTTTRKVSVSSCSTNQYGTSCTMIETSSSIFTSSGQSAGSGSSIQYIASVQQTTHRLCPPVVDFSDPAYSVPGGPSGLDGKCPTGRYSRPVTPAQVGEAFTASPPPSTDSGFLDALKGAVSAGEDVPATVSTEGPASQTGTPSKTTTTDAGGTKTVTETPTYTYNYAGDTITYNTSVNTTTTNNDGSTTTTTTTTEGTKPDDKEDPCVKNPNRVGCMDLGAAPDDRIPKSTRDVSFASEDLGLASSCPAPVDLPHGQKISYQTLCDGLTQTRPLIIAIGFLMAGGIVVAALRR